MTVNFQLVIDCTNPERLARSWAAALGYEPEPPPAGFATWDEYWRDVGVPEEDLGLGVDCIIDPGGAGPRIWFQVVPEAARRSSYARKSGTFTDRRVWVSLGSWGLPDSVMC